MADFTLTLDGSSAPAGDVTFAISNDAQQEHEFVVLKTDLAKVQLPFDAEGNVDEEGEGVEHIDEIEGVQSGSSESLTVTSTPRTTC